MSTQGLIDRIRPLLLLAAGALAQGLSARRDQLPGADLHRPQRPRGRRAHLREGAVHVREVKLMQHSTRYNIEVSNPPVTYELYSNRCILLPLITYKLLNMSKLKLTGQQTIKIHPEFFVSHPNQQ